MNCPSDTLASRPSRMDRLALLLDLGCWALPLRATLREKHTCSVNCSVVRIICPYGQRNTTAGQADKTCALWQRLLVRVRAGGSVRCWDSRNDVNDRGLCGDIWPHLVGCCVSVTDLLVLCKRGLETAEADHVSMTMLTHVVVAQLTAQLCTGTVDGEEPSQ
jgi:hypothetical protein